jgi:hypothetical protein
MRIKDSLLVRIPLEYNRLINNKIVKLEEEIISANRNIRLYEKLVLKNASKIFDHSITNMIGRIDGGEYDVEEVNIIYSKLGVGLSNRANSKDTTTIVSNFSKENNKIILTYLLKLKKFIILYDNKKQRLTRYKKLVLSDVTLRYIVKHIFKHIQFYIFKTRIGFTLPNGITIRIIGKSISHSEAKTGRKLQKPDWVESLNTLKAIAKEEQLDIYNKFINKDISKSEFITLMKPHVYSSDNPNGKKWIVFRERDLNFWLVFFTLLKFKGVNRDNLGLSEYSITPTNGISLAVVKDLGIERKQSELIKLMKSVDDIIETGYLGFRDKLRMIETFDMQYCKDTFNYKMS